MTYKEEDFFVLVTYPMASSLKYGYIAAYPLALEALEELPCLTLIAIP